ncbi:amino acid ABC transporter permease [Luteipulveratus sp. YIM 133132]|uniref:amino acid ABC transporter permease n=1 Tax=Luteipulveratus flavus TaxID=3031728 RepID=UPI0023B10704|nr:amino acid ABC transporter permease [Luteipulveratus sp. YIM 133132]MDE9365896.1 amino acid ABC transporter permease [Luteipulveratus sp. YIM 133132]
MTAGTSVDQEARPGKIEARPVRHPWRYVGVVIIALLVAMIISSLVTNERWDLPFALRVMNYKPIIQGLIQGTIIGTVGAMIIGIVGGILLAMMRLSENPVLRGVAFLYTWFFRAIPRLVLLAMLGTGVGYLYPKLDFGLPFSQQITSAFGMSNDLTFYQLDVNSISNGIIIGILGLGLSEAAYMAEIARAGIQSVDRGQSEAAQALGMSNGKAMRRVILPQAMRVIVPPTGNETIAMVKDTSLLSIVPVTAELWYQITVVGSRTLKIMPTYVAGFAWYLVICTILMIGQYFLERRFGRGFGTTAPGRTRMLGLGSREGGA